MMLLLSISSGALLALCDEDVVENSWWRPMSAKQAFPKWSTRMFDDVRCPWKSLALL